MATLFAVLAIFLFVFPATAQNLSSKFLRSKLAALLFFGTALLWFVYILSQLGEADFGDIKGILIAIFGGAGLLAFKFLPDFLSVRGAAILALLGCRICLDSAYMQDPQSRLVLVTLSYVIVFMALYFGAIPYRLRDVLNKIFEKDLRVKILAGVSAVCASALVVASLAY